MNREDSRDYHLGLLFFPIDTVVSLQKQGYVLRVACRLFHYRGAGETKSRELLLTALEKEQNELSSLI